MQDHGQAERWVWLRLSDSVDSVEGEEVGDDGLCAVPGYNFAV
jgi:hypothetical protein